MIEIYGVACLLLKNIRDNNYMLWLLNVAPRARLISFLGCLLTIGNASIKFLIFI